MHNPYDNRGNFVWAFIGANTTGKTPTAVKLARNWKKTRPEGKIRGFDPRNGFENAKLLAKEDKIMIGDEEWAQKLLVQNVRQKYIHRDFLLILDDYKMLCKGDETDPFLLDLLQARVEKNMDAIIICHAPMLITPRLAYFITDYSIFYNKASLASFGKRIDDFEICQEAAVVINEYVKKFGRGVYPKFPHVHVHPEKNIFDCVNMEASKLKQLSCIKI